MFKEQGYLTTSCWTGSFYSAIRCGAWD